jgi:hypothetical protein
VGLPSSARRRRLLVQVDVDRSNALAKNTWSRGRRRCHSSHLVEAAEHRGQISEELRRAGWYEKTSQAFAVFLPVKSVGVTSDGRRHEPVIALRAVETVDFMTGHWAHLPYELLDVCS